MAPSCLSDTPTSARPWRRRARYVEPQAVPAAEQIGDREKLDGDRIDLPRHHQSRPFRAVAIAHPQQALGQVHRKAVREVRVGRIDIDQFGREVGVGSVGSDPQPHCDRPGDFEFMVERRRREHQYVRAKNGGALVEGAGMHHRLTRADRAAHRRWDRVDRRRSRPRPNPPPALQQGSGRHAGRGASSGSEAAATRPRCASSRHGMGPRPEDQLHPAALRPR